MIKERTFYNEAKWNIQDSYTPTQRTMPLDEARLNQAITSKYWTWSTDIDNISGKYKGGGINNKKHYQFEAILSENSLFY